MDLPVGGHTCRGLLTQGTQPPDTRLLLLDTDVPTHLWVVRLRGLLSSAPQPFNLSLSVCFLDTPGFTGPLTTTTGGRRAFSSRFWGGGDVYLCQALGTMLERCSLYIPRIGLVGIVRVGVHANHLGSSITTSYLVHGILGNL